MKTKRERLKLIVRGAVQGVGFRPFVFRLADRLKLTGRVLNSSQGVLIEAEGPRQLLQEFLLRIEKEKPPLAVIHSIEPSFLECAGYDKFEIIESAEAGSRTTLILPDIATCAGCLREIFDPGNRRHLYPFTNCTNCGPRFSIIGSLPYDRPHTSMKSFRMCALCEAEYHDPRDRRFHAQPNACPNCGPQLALLDEAGTTLGERHDALLGTAAALRAGRIAALKGVGGFQLLVDARNEDAVRRLRQRKNREDKPFALMYPSLEAVRADVVVSPLEERLLLSPESPIVLLERRFQDESLIAPKSHCLGIMLPYTPLHHLLMRELGFPIVATSGNLTDEPICTGNHEALDRLHGIADLFLVHDRPIVRHVDDSVVRVMLGRELVMRRARGYAPLPVHMKDPMPPMLAVGAHLKNSIALSVDHDVFISQHIGDLETQPAHQAFCKVCCDFEHLYEVVPEIIACDMHPDYLSTKFARSLRTPLAWVQHHYAHVLSCMAENEVEAPVLGVAWDGTGYATDGTIWGGEFLHVDETSFHRAAHLRTFRLPGGDAAVKQPRRAALGLLYEIYGDSLFNDRNAPAVKEFTEAELTPLRQMLARGINAPPTSSAGRLFDAVSSLIGLRQQVSFEGQAAMELECLAVHEDTRSYPFELIENAGIVIDWEPMIRGILQDVVLKKPAGLMASKFHHTLADMIVAVAKRVGEPKIVLSGGCFQNKLLTERVVHSLEAGGFRPFWHQRVPPNDGGIALGQVMAAVRALPAVIKREEALVT